MTKPFIDKKSCRAFKLVSRPAEELEAANAEGRELNPRVFVEITTNINNSFDDQSPFEDSNASFENPTPGEAMKYGILFDDRYYDYSKHLRTVGTALGGVILDAPTNQQPAAKEEVEEIPASIDTSDPTIKETIEALNDGAYLQQDNFEDDIVELLNQEDPDSESNSDMGEEFDELVKEFKCKFDPNESCSYDQELLNNSEEIFFEKIDHCEDEDPIDLFNTILAKLKLEDEARIPDLSDFDSDAAFEEWELSESEPDNIETCSRDPCLGVKPHVISEIQISKKTGLPVRNDYSDTDGEIHSQLPKINYGLARPKKETPEQKKERKAQAKLLRLEKRQSKKVQ